MVRALKQIGDTLDRFDAAGWLLLLAGVAVVALTALAPAYLDTRELAAQCRVMTRQARLLDGQHENYIQLVHAVRENDPLLIQRVAWQQLHVKPPGAKPLAWYYPAAAGPPPSVEQWVQPIAPPLRPEVPRLDHPDTRLMRLITGPPRPWVLAFGGWLILLGLMINPQAPAPEPIRES